MNCTVWTKGNIFTHSHVLMLLYTPRMLKPEEIAKVLYHNYYVVLDHKV